MEMKRERQLWGSALAVSVFVVGFLLASPSDTTALVDALNSESEAATELIWIQDEIIRMQGEQISGLELQISNLESLVEVLETARESLLNSLSTTSETQPP